MIERIVIDPALVERALSRRETAHRLGCSTQTVRRLVEAGVLPPPRAITPGRVGHLESEVVAYLRSRPVEPLVGRTAAANRARETRTGDEA